MSIGSSFHIGGLASGMDIDSKIEKLMEAERKPLDKMKQQKQELEWKQQDYRDINKKLRSFEDTAFDMKLQSSYMVSSATSSDESAVTASASPSALEGVHRIKVDQLASGASVTSDKMGSSDDLSTLSSQLGVWGEREIEINDVLFEIDTDNESIYNLVDKINSYESSHDDFNVQASYDKTVDRFYLSTKDTGEDQQITVRNNWFADQLALTSNSNSNINTADGSYSGDAAVTAGKDANITIDDVEYNNEFSSNRITLNNVTYNLNNTTSSEVTVNVSRDTDKIVDNITSFIDKYNKTIKNINDELDEPYYSDYQPLTDAQREELTDDQINKWIEKAKSGLLHNDSVLSNISNKMRMTMSTVVDTEGDYNNLSEIGIKTTRDYNSDQLVIDEDVLRSAVENNPEDVMDLFTKDPESEEYSEMGVARRLYEDIENGMDRISDKAGSSNDFSLTDDSFLGNKIERVEDRIDVKEERLEKTEERYWDQFTRMEQAIQKANQQSAWLSQQLGGGMSM
ncbi:MAG: flagellar filament capping protein FliD [Clostridiales bacterium]|nr:flagellar filament capping protein FliD [Clostridiales bacterium]MCF8021729.1 flagellar filament capping protein FliD [Clostridiales bacterium]